MLPVKPMAAAPGNLVGPTPGSSLQLLACHSICCWGSVGMLSSLPRRHTMMSQGEDEDGFAASPNAGNAVFRYSGGEQRAPSSLLSPAPGCRWHPLPARRSTQSPAPPPAPGAGTSQHRSGVSMGQAPGS